MMGVVVHHGHSPGLADKVETAANAGELLQLLGRQIDIEARSEMSVSTAAPLETLCSPGFCLMRLATTRPSATAG